RRRRYVNAPAPHEGEPPAVVPDASSLPPALREQSGAPAVAAAAAATAGPEAAAPEAAAAAAGVAMRGCEDGFEGSVADVAPVAAATAAAVARDCAVGVERPVAEDFHKAAPARGSGVVGLDADAEPWKGGDAAIVRHQQQQQHPQPQALDGDFPSFEADPPDLESGRDEYSVTISSRKLGMTVENVLERTVVRAAAPGGGAEAAGVETGSLLVALDGLSMKDSSHFEVIELLRVANRPLTLRLRRAIVRLLLDFSGLLERDWCRDRQNDPRGNGAHENGNPNIGGGVEAGGEAGVGMGTAGRRIESMGVVLEQLAPLVDWDSETVAAVEPELLELLCVLLDADLHFDLSSNKFPHYIGGAAAGMLHELLLHLPFEQAALEALALAHRLALSISVCARGACCALVAQTYGLPPLPRQLQLRGILSRLLHDPIAGVRGEAVKALALVATVADASAGRWLLLLGE
ncbi:unnamed protein product, partial [Laminaria digitata]